MERSDIKRIGQILKDRRLQLGYTQEFAAEKVGISYSYYTKIERGE
nr:helix-turn-helix transcriptional regulator [uncultured Schaedlerella sp.]